MKKNSASHGLAVLVCTVASGLLVKLGHEQFPEIAEHLQKQVHTIVNYLDLGLECDDVISLMLAVVLAVVWGIAFALAQSERK